MGHYARECPLPPTTCMYCHASDHDTEECPTLLLKIQEKRNQNNQNVQWIFTEARDEGWNINIVTQGGAKIGDNTIRQELAYNQWVKRMSNPGISSTCRRKRRYLSKLDKNLRRNVLR
jgi:hypothetical protein